METTEEMLAKLRIVVEVREVGRGRPTVPRKDAFASAEMILQLADPFVNLPHRVYFNWSEATGYDIALTDEECIRLACHTPYAYPYLRAVFREVD